MNARTADRHSIDWCHGAMTDWAYLDDYLITRLPDKMFMLERLDDECQPLVHIGFFDDIDTVLMVIRHDQKVEV